MLRIRIKRLRTRNEQIATIGEKITIRRYVRYQMGEGLEKGKIICRRSYESNES